MGWLIGKYTGRTIFTLIVLSDSALIDLGLIPLVFCAMDTLYLRDVQYMSYTPCHSFFEGHGHDRRKVQYIGGL